MPMNALKQTVFTLSNINPSGLYSVQQVADILGVTSKTVRRWIDKGKVLAVRPGPCSTRIPGHVVANLIGHTTESEEVR